MKTIKRIIKWIVLIILLLFMMFNIYSYINIKILNNKLTSLGKYAVLEVVSPSMEPTIHVGDLIVIDIKDNDYEVNDIVTYEDENGLLVTHRIIEVSDDYIITQGDNNNSNDGEISLDTIYGKLLFSSHALGVIISILRNKIVLFLIFIIGILVCVELDNKEKK